MAQYVKFRGCNAPRNVAMAMLSRPSAINIFPGTMWRMNAEPMFVNSPTTVIGIKYNVTYVKIASTRTNLDRICLIYLSIEQTVPIEDAAPETPKPDAVTKQDPAKMRDLPYPQWHQGAGNPRFDEHEDPDEGGSHDETKNDPPRCPPVGRNTRLPASQSDRPWDSRNPETQQTKAGRDGDSTKPINPPVGVM